MREPLLFFGSAVIGLLTGLDNYLFSYGMARLPVSTSSLIIASQLAFTAGFAFLLVKQRFTSYTVNAVVLLTIGGAILALHSSGDRPAGESNKEYIAGFLMTLGAAVLYGLILPLIELMYKKTKQSLTYTLILEIQLVMSLFGTILCTIGMLINNDFQVISLSNSLTTFSIYFQHFSLYFIFYSYSFPFVYVIRVIYIYILRKKKKQLQRY